VARVVDGVCVRGGGGDLNRVWEHLAHGRVGMLHAHRATHLDHGCSSARWRLVDVVPFPRAAEALGGERVDNVQGTPLDEQPDNTTGHTSTRSFGNLCDGRGQQPNKSTGAPRRCSRGYTVCSGGRHEVVGSHRRDGALQCSAPSGAGPSASQARQAHAALPSHEGVSCQGVGVQHLGGSTGVESGTAWDPVQGSEWSVVTAALLPQSVPYLQRKHKGRRGACPALPSSIPQGFCIH
jgi:hypothetical protein